MKNFTQIFSSFLVKQFDKKNSEKKEENKNIFKAVLFILIIIAALTILHFSPLKYYLNTAHFNIIKEQLDEHYIKAPIIFFLISSLILTLGAPRTIISIAGGSLFGCILGTFWALLATLLGSYIIFIFTQKMGRPLFQQKAKKYLNVIEEYIEDHGLLIVIIIRQLPVANIILNILFGLTKLSSKAFLIGSVIGFFPEAFIFALYGSSVRGNFGLKIFMASLLLILLSLIITVWYKKSGTARKIKIKFAAVKNQ